MQPVEFERERSENSRAVVIARLVQRSLAFVSCYCYCSAQAFRGAHDDACFHWRVYKSREKRAPESFAVLTRDSEKPEHRMHVSLSLVNSIERGESDCNIYI